ncbi:hypothetical protein J437_LFUL003131 [Ladona fulva]|uniref:Uncharacterized protein n=1 Tax=Ladona fulva TaxID=123851 RepID=A0A8K0KT66_LADFU|nr:hypothetical protein J437_LFUL003131 [Ladona fulva]
MGENERRGSLQNNLKVSGNGSWEKLGLTSLYCVTTLIGYYSGKVMELIVKGSYCEARTFWNKKMGTAEYSEWFRSDEKECVAYPGGSAC